MSLARIHILLNEPPIGVIRPELHGQFAEHLGACVDEGLWVGEDSSIPNLGGIRSDVLDALRQLHVPALRWPGGCFADDYHWTDGIGPRKDRPRTVNLWWGPSTSSGQAPSTSSGQAPSTSSGQAPSTSSGQAPSTSSGQAPSTSSGQAPSTSSGQAPSTSSGQAPSTSSGQAPSTSSGQAPSTSSGQAPLTNSGQAPSTSSGQGQSVETNAFGTHEFMRLCGFLGAKPYLAGNVGSGSPREMRDWMEYCNFAGSSTLARRRGQNGSPQPFGVEYWGVGNEAWGCGGNFCPEDYAREYKRFATYLPGFGTDPCLIACGPDGNKRDWTRRFLTKFFSTPDHFNRRLNAIAAHYYCGTACQSATAFDTNEWYQLLHQSLQMERVIVDQRAVMDEFDPQRKIKLMIDEWGTWHAPTPGASKLWQQNTLRDALAAAMTLDVFNRHADKVAMANIAQVANVLQAMVLTQGDRMVLTPTYHVFDLYQAHRNARSIPIRFETDSVSFAMNDSRQTLPQLTGSASIANGKLTVSVVNAHASLPAEAQLELTGGGSPREASAHVITHRDLSAHNTFEETDAVRPAPASVDLTANAIHHVFPPSSITVIRMIL